MNKIIKWGFIGCGEATEKKSGPAFNCVRESTVVAVMGRDQEKTKTYAKRNRISKWYTDAQELIDDPEVNAVYIATPPSSHATYAIMSMKANVSINVIKKENLDKLLVSLRFVQDVAKGDRPFYQHPIFVVGVFTLVIIAILYWFFGTELGCSMRATGSNPNMARAQGINTDRNKVLAMMIANGLVALSGSLLAQFQSYGDINMGRGAIVIGLAAVIIGEVVFGKIFRNFGLKLLAVSLGAVIYYVVIQAVLSFGQINSNYLKLISATIVAIFLSVPYWKGKYFTKPVKRGGTTHA